MGGRSFKCPQCSQWFLSKGALRDHLVDKHDEPVGFDIVGVGESTRVVRHFARMTRRISAEDLAQRRVYGGRLADSIAQGRTTADAAYTLLLECPEGGKHEWTPMAGTAMQKCPKCGSTIEP